MSSKTNFFNYIAELISLVDNKTNVIMNSLAVFAAILSISIKFEIINSELPLDFFFDGLIVIIFIYYVIVGPYLLWRQNKILIDSVYLDKPNYEVDWELLKITNGYDLSEIENELKETQQRISSLDKTSNHEEKLFAENNLLEKLNSHLLFAKNLNELIEQGYYAIYFKIKNIGGQMDEFIVTEISANENISFVKRRDIDKNNFLKNENREQITNGKKPYINKKLRVHNDKEASVPIRRMKVGDKALIPNGHPLFFKINGDNPSLQVEIKSDNLGRVFSKEIKVNVNQAREVGFVEMVRWEILYTQNAWRLTVIGFW